VCCVGNPPDVSHVSDLVLGDEGNVGGHGQSYGGGQGGGLGEEVEVAHGKCLSTAGGGQHKIRQF